jgi:hypothetical protein
VEFDHRIEKPAAINVLGPSIVPYITLQHMEQPDRANAPNGGRFVRFPVGITDDFARARCRTAEDTASFVCGTPRRGEIF